MNRPAGHRLNDLRSLRLHAFVAALIRENPGLLVRVRAKLEWLESRGMAKTHARRWREILDRPVPEILDFITSDCEEAAELRQASPFTAAGLVPSRERWRILKETSGDAKTD